MNASEPLDNLDACGCGAEAPPVPALDNVPGLSALAYRVGTHARFKQAMLARLDAGLDPGLRGLRTRADDDFAIALLDAWATVGDVLAFYQERIANESYLRTATERLSLMHLARLIGYQPRPGVAASVFLAFTLESADGSPAAVEIPAGARSQSVPAAGEMPQPFETAEPFTARVEWNALGLQRTKPAKLDAAATEVTLATASANLRPGDFLLLVRSRSQGMLRQVQSVDITHATARTVVKLAPAEDADRADGTLPEPGIYVLRTRAALFGHNAPDWNVVPGTIRVAYARAHPGAIITSSNDWPVSPLAPRTLDLDSVYAQVAPGSCMVVLRPGLRPNAGRITAVSEQSAALYILSGRFTRLQIDHELPASQSKDARFPRTMEELRRTAVLAQSEQLPQADAPFDPLTPTYLRLSLPDANLKRGQPLAITGRDADTQAPAAEIAVIADVSGVQVFFHQPLSRRYDPDSVAVNANVAAASHGETVGEVLGAGDASQAYQRFTLRQPPLTHVSAANAAGAESTLRTRVDGVLWHEVASLLGRGPQERVYITRTGDDGRTTLQFGDGATGARLSSGRDNVQAAYRKGIGRAGQVGAGTITLPLTRPPGLQTVVNPVSASGAQDPETPDEIRSNAPLTIVTLDRLVSLRDYEDFTRAFAGIAKALATEAWVNGRRGIVLTVAGLDGAAVDPESALRVNLLAALRGNGDPHLPILVRSYRHAAFQLSALLEIDADFRPDRVRQAVRDDLRRRFGFAARAFAQPVSDDEIIAGIQAVPGVLAVTLVNLARTGAAAGDAVPGMLVAAPPGPDARGELQAAELLLLAPSPSEPVLGDMT